MSSLFLVRHGQASFMQDNYDQLSPLGARQAKVLGEHWAALGVRIDRVYVGPKQRHHQTEQAVASIYQTRGLFWPVPESLPELDEHQGFEVMQHILPDLVKTDPVIGKLVGSSMTIDRLEPIVHLKILRHVMRLWVRDEVNAGDFESWPAFKSRVQAGLNKITLANDG
ncbi:MAG: histidine phosphatase family protein, partial [Chloroflexi bacterium]|nr:histidine phosphatase family protein [Chloroflexota bacterium]